MNGAQFSRKIIVPVGSSINEQQYRDFLIASYALMAKCPQYFAATEDFNSLELAHLVPHVKETVLTIYVGINDAVCNKGLVTACLPRHSHNNVFVFDNQVWSGGDNVPSGTTDAKIILKGFEPPNSSWNSRWTYIMVQDPHRSFQSLWREKGYIDMIPAKFEDFTMLTDIAKSKLCTFVDAKAFDHPVNKRREYLKAARDRGQRMASEFVIPAGMNNEYEGLVPVVLNQGQKLYIATTDFGPCAHGWTNIHPGNEELAVVNENSAVPLNLVIAKPPVNTCYARDLIAPKGSADMTTDWFYRGRQILRMPLLEGLFKG